MKTLTLERLRWMAVSVLLTAVAHVLYAFHRVRGNHDLADELAQVVCEMWNIR